jgi:septal ring factor EnvC (AmiA/AmiB activator)
MLSSAMAFAQNKKEVLETEKKQIEAEIKYTNQLLAKVTTSKTNSLQELVLINNRIKQREKLISNFSSEIKNLDQVITTNNNILNSLEEELEQAKSEYALLINYVFKNKNSQDRLMYVFAASSFNQAFQRLKYLQYYSDYRKQQALRINQMQDSISKTNKEISSQRVIKQKLLQQQQKEIATLQLEKSQQSSKVNVLAKQERQFRAEIRQKRNEAERLNKAINDIISQEIKSAAATAKTSGTENLSGIIALTPAELELTNTFSQNKGKLPWPAEHGILSSTFGEHDHPVLKRIKIKNNGIDILTNVGENARAIFNGKVISVRTITNSNKAVIIRHGEYFTVYSNLIDVFVNSGDEVKTKQDLGVIYHNSAESKTELHFEIWKGKTLLNPQLWVSK